MRILTPISLAMMPLRVVLPKPGGLDKDLQVALGLLLPDILPQGLGAQGTLVLVIPRQRCGDERLLGLKPGIGKVNAQTLTSSLNA